MSLEYRTNPGNGMWFAAAGALIAMVVLAFPGIGAIEAILTAATGSEAAAGGGVGEAIRASGGGFGAALVALVGIVVLDVIVAWALWGVFRPAQPATAALAAALRITYSAVFAAAIGLLVDAQRLAAGVGATEALPVETRDELALQRLAEFDSIWSGALIIFGAHLAVVAWLLLRHGGAFAAIVGAFVVIAAVGYVFDGTLPLIVPEWSGGIAQFTFIGEVLLIVWLLVGGIRSARSARRQASMAQAGPTDAATRVSA
ncbi:DUF4386 domain-containing protein [Agromyces albus]|uniref:DUF4386 domain-containing protein n=1 Tax=Agromyces albus TaxID=205332 RepID=A0A4Q2L495_9MICO|nr:DUF4386 domain-containing protein [Agromyces albus]RXZ70931.1 DUF4386 domain-containing protein [Agromyces albus]